MVMPFCGILIPYFELLLAGLTSDGDAEATGAGTAEKADLGKGMTCWYELLRGNEVLVSGFESDIAFFELLVKEKKLEDDIGRMVGA
jgi:hypothetical protein